MCALYGCCTRSSVVVVRGKRNSNCGGCCCCFHENSMQLLRVNLKTQITRLRQDVKLKCKAQWINYSLRLLFTLVNSTKPLSIIT